MNISCCQYPIGHMILQNAEFHFIYSIFFPFKMEDIFYNGWVKVFSALFFTTIFLKKIKVTDVQK